MADLRSALVSSAFNRASLGILLTKIKIHGLNDVGIELPCAGGRLISVWWRRSLLESAQRSPRRGTVYVLRVTPIGLCPGFRVVERG